MPFGGNCGDDTVAGSTSETETIETHRFSFLVYGWLAALRWPGAHQRFADTWPTANARTQWPLWVKTGKARCEHMFSALPLKRDVAQRGRHVRVVPRNRQARQRGS